MGGNRHTYKRTQLKPAKAVYTRFHPAEWESQPYPILLDHGLMRSLQWLEDWCLYWIWIVCVVTSITLGVML